MEVQQKLPRSRQERQSTIQATGVTGAIHSYACARLNTYVLLAPKRGPARVIVSTRQHAYIHLLALQRRKSHTLRDRPSSCT